MHKPKSVVTMLRFKSRAKRYASRKATDFYTERGTNHTPSPAEIRRVCLEIQAEWTEQERRSRIAQDLSDEYLIPTIKPIAMSRGRGWIRL